MITLELVKITDTSGKMTGEPGKVTFQALNEDQLDNLYNMESSYGHIGWNFKVERLGDVQVLIGKAKIWNLEQIEKETFIEAETRTGEDSVVETSDEVVLNFSNGKEISICLNSQGEIVVEGD